MMRGRPIAAQVLVLPGKKEKKSKEDKDKIESGNPHDAGCGVWMEWIGLEWFAVVWVGVEVNGNGLDEFGTVRICFSFFILVYPLFVMAIK